MTNWQTHWNDSTGSVVHGDYFQQVGRTVGGKAVPSEQLAYLVESVINALDIAPGHLVLDICCGNGQVTKRLAEHCLFVVGVDFSGPLIETAQKHFAAPNIRYIRASATDLPNELLPSDPHDVGRGFNRVALCDAMQYFSPDEMLAMLGRLRSLCRPGFAMFCGGIPDQARLRDFYNTDARRSDYEQRMARDGRDALGHWWQRQSVVDLAHRAGFDCRIIDQAAGRYTAHYRFDALLISQGHDTHLA